MTESQHAEGGWRYQPGERGDLSVTGWYIMALASAQMSGIPVPDETLRRRPQVPRLGPRRRARRLLRLHRFAGQAELRPPRDERGRLLLLPAARRLAERRPGLGIGADPRQVAASTSTTSTTSTTAPSPPTSTRDRCGGTGGTDAAGFRQSAGTGTVRGSAGGRPRRRDGPVIGTALTVLCLEAHYRYTPLYGLGYEPDPTARLPTRSTGDQLPPTPLFRHAKYLEALQLPRRRHRRRSSPTTATSSTSPRPRGAASADRTSTARGSAAKPGRRRRTSAPRSTAPPTRPTPPSAWPASTCCSTPTATAGQGALYSAKSRRLVRRYDYAKLPGAAWILRNLPWLLAFSSPSTACTG